MPSSKASKSETMKSAAKTVGRLYFLDLGSGRVITSNPDGSGVKTIVSEGKKLPDGIVVDVARGHIYWTNMGSLKANDGSIDRADLDGGNITSDMDGNQIIYTTFFASNGAPTGAIPTPVESIEEFNVAISNQTADFNGASGGQIQLVTKRGANVRGLSICCFEF